MSARNHFSNPETRPPDKGTRERCCYLLESVIGGGHEKRRTTKSKVSITCHKCNTFLCKDDLSYTSTYSKYQKKDKPRKYSFKF